jgi:DNA primase catalytic subunit
MSLIANTVARLEVALRALDSRLSALEHGSSPATACAADIEHKLARYECDKCKLEQSLEEVRNSISSGMKKERSIIEAVLDQKVGVLVEDALAGDKLALAAEAVFDTVGSKVSATATSALELASSLDTRMQTLEATLKGTGSITTISAAIEELEPSPALDEEAPIDTIEMISIDSSAAAAKGKGRAKSASKGP